MAKLMIAILAALGVVLATAGGHQAAAQTGEVIRSFDVTYVISQDGSLSVTEDILVDFSPATDERHGIFRFIPQEVTFDSEFNRLFLIENISVDDGESPWRIDLDTSGPNLRIRIGDPDVVVTGEQRYRIMYTIQGGLNESEDFDELFWNVTGHEWLATIENASATVELPGGGILQIECFQGPLGSTDECQSSSDDSSARFETTSTQFPGSGLTIAVAIEKGRVQVAPPILVDANVSAGTQVKDFLGAGPVTIPIAILILVATLGLIVRQWWIVGRDRWFGDQYYHSDAPDPTRKPMFSNETIVVEYEPPKVAGQDRRMRPAEVGLLLDEKADTLDVSATIVDLAVRGYLKIEELEKDGFFGSTDYELHNLGKDTSELLPYERTLLSALVEGESSVRLNDLKNEFHKDLAKVKEELYDQGVKKNNFFARNPETVRSQYGLVGVIVVVAGGLAVWVLGAAAEIGVVGIPIVIAGALLAVLSGAMPRRTARGRQMFRRILGFRTFMTAGDQSRERFAEDANIFSEYLPYAVVFGSAKKWAERFEALGIETGNVGWYVGPHAFMAVAFATNIRTFSTSMGGVMASTPGGSGGSGFGGGGFSGGGGGGGGGGGW